MLQLPHWPIYSSHIWSQLPENSKQNEVVSHFTLKIKQWEILWFLLHVEGGKYVCELWCERSGFSPKAVRICLWHSSSLHITPTIMQIVG